MNDSQLFSTLTVARAKQLWDEHTKYQEEGFEVSGGLEFVQALEKEILLNLAIKAKAEPIKHVWPELPPLCPHGNFNLCFLCNADSRRHE